MVVADPSSPQAPAGHTLVVCLPASNEALDQQLRAIGFDVQTVDNPFAAFVELLDRPLVYRSVVLSLAAIYREELPLIKAIRSRLPHIDVLLTHTDGRAGAMAEAMRLGATGLLDDQAVHRIGDIDPPPGSGTPHVQTGESTAPAVTSDATEPAPNDDDFNDLDPILTAEELRALLHEQPTLPGHG